MILSLASNQLDRTLSKFPAILRSVEILYFSQFYAQGIETGFHALGTECEIYFFARLAAINGVCYY